MRRLRPLLLQLTEGDACINDGLGIGEEGGAWYKCSEGGGAGEGGPYLRVCATNDDPPLDAHVQHLRHLEGASCEELVDDDSDARVTHDGIDSLVQGRRGRGACMRVLTRGGR